MADYCTVTDIKNQIPDSGLNDTTAYDVGIGALITACSRLIDREVGQYPNYFYPSGVDEVRYFDGNGESTLRIDDAVSITSVYVAEQGDLTDYTLWSSSDFDYEVLPSNYAAIGSPIRSLTTDIWNSDKGRFPLARKAVKVTGVFGYSTNPPFDIKQACIIQVSRWYMRAKQAWQDGGGNAQVGDTVINIGGRANISKLDTDVQQILYHYLVEGMA